jgi:4-aminobutyrate aminotransferase-like enzyme
MESNSNSNVTAAGHSNPDIIEAVFAAEPVMGEGGIIAPPKAYFKKVKEEISAN